MNLRKILLPALLFVSFTGHLSLSGQENLLQVSPDETVTEQTDSLALKPFQVIGITRAFGETNQLVDESAKKHLTQDVVTEFTKELDTLVSQIDRFLGEIVPVSLEGVSSRELDELNQRAEFYMDKTGILQNRISKQALVHEKESALLQELKQRWQLTLEQENDDQALVSREGRIEKAIGRIDSVRFLLQEDLTIILEAQDQITDKKTALQEVVTRVKDQKLKLGETILDRDVPGFFKDLAHLHDSNLMRSHYEEFVKGIRTDVELLKSGYMRSLVIYLVFLVALLVFAIWFKKHQDRLISREHAQLSKQHAVFINSPVVSTVFFITLLIRLQLPDLPRTFFAINMVAMMVPIAILMVKVYGGIFRAWIIGLVIVTFVNLLYELAYHPGGLLRILMLGLSFIGIWLFAWIYRKRPFSALIKHRYVYLSFRALVIVFLGMQCASIIANLAGDFHLTEFLTLIPVQITFLAIAVQLTTRFVDTIIYVTLSSNYFQKLHVIREFFGEIYRKITRMTDFLLLLVFLSYAFRILRIRDLVFDWGRSVLSDGRKIGAIDISLGSVLTFVFVIWLSIMISRILSRILEKDVFTRVKTAKGIPGTVVLLMKIALISGGFFLAAAASGMQLTNLSIVLGAFSVGIGFGLQNIFNNMVSGLILAFERPINVGDVVQVGELLGMVKSIGLRSSTIHSFDGAEVIVPNGNLISNEMINWTLSDSFRRLDIRMGVAYGTDPDRVLAILKELAENHPGVMKKPPPMAYFVEFGDSSLNFRLLAWVHMDHRLEIESELNVLINKKIKEAGIEIPFPQRDLHIRSDSTKPTQGS